MFESGSLVGVVPHVGRRLRGNRAVLEGGGGRGGGGGAGICFTRHMINLQ